MKTPVPPGKMIRYFLDNEKCPTYITDIGEIEFMKGIKKGHKITKRIEVKE